MLLNGSPASITREVHRCLAQGNETSIISGGCETPQATPPCNLRAVAQALAGGI
ncbi:uroporphyrinogen decarboxylase family protein [Ruthenibacterium lactatiformans]|uniref:uroporphyrinogen decarboxylase family protein n=1 Tax=Ruthenibacterium lactatiformans TaxID=1550024 RepID=UPI0034C62647